jgi:hypothetical protein
VGWRWGDFQVVEYDSSWVGRGVSQLELAQLIEQNAPAVRHALEAQDGLPAGLCPLEPSTARVHGTGI